MNVATTNAATGTQGSAAQTAGVSKGVLTDYQSFLNLFVTQLKYQDPLNPTSQEDFLAQTAQFSTVEQLIKLNTQMDGVSSSSRVSAAALIGKKVEGTVTLDDGSTTTVSGVVSQVEYDSAGSLTLGLQGGAKMAFSDVETISQN